MSTIAVLHIKKSRKEIKQAIRSIPQDLVRGGKADKIMAECATAMLELIHDAFVVKSTGGTDESGERWAPLKPTTIAYRQTRTATQRSRQTRPSQGLTKKQQDKWWEFYRQGLAINKGNKSAAAKFAWAKIKSMGGQTLLTRYGMRRADILNHSGKLLESLTPGSNSPDQVINITPNGVTVGTSVEYAMVHHMGSPAKGIPQRRLWPEPKDWPQSWWDKINERIQLGIANMVGPKVRGLIT